MRVVVNRWLTGGRLTGIGHYTAQLLRSLRDQAGAGEGLVPFPPAWWQAARRACQCVRGWLPRGPERGDRVTARGWVREWGTRLVGWRFRAHCVRHRADLYHEPNYIPLPCDVPAVVTVHDLSVLRHPEWHPADRVAHHERHFLRALATARRFIAVSEFTRREMIRLLNVPPSLVVAVHNGIRPEFRPLPAESVRPALARLGLPPSYLLHVGTLEPRKNLLTLARAYCDLPGRLRQRCPLLLVGGWGWGAADLADFLDRRGRAQGIIHLGYVPEAQLPALYNGARALVCPSHYEGFGFPPVEMLACGGAVLCSTAGALAETAGVSAHLVDADDLAGWRDALSRVIADDDWRDGLRRGAVAAARPYTWERCAAETWAVYRAALGQSVPLPRAA